MKKFCKNYLYYHLVADILAVVLYALAFIDELLTEDDLGAVTGVKNEAIPFFILGALGVYVLIILYQVLYLRTSGYALTENEIRVQRGVLFRKNSILEYRKMHAINKKQNIIQRFFGLAVLTVDSGSANTSKTGEIVVYEKTEIVDALLLELKARKNGEVFKEETKEPSAEAFSSKRGDFVFSSGKKMAYSLLNIATAAFAMLLICFLALLVYVSLVPVLKDILAGGVFYILVPALMIALAVLVGMSVLTFVASIL